MVLEYEVRKHHSGIIAGKITVTKKKRAGEIEGKIPENKTRSLDDADNEEGVPKWGTARFNARTNLILTVRHNSAQLVLNANEVEELVIGRFDPDSKTGPDIDLLPYDAIEKGVSRRHAAIMRYNGALNIVDLNSGNGTYLNGQRLVAQQPRMLRDGDEIRLGHLAIAISFVRASD